MKEMRRKTVLMAGRIKEPWMNPILMIMEGGQATIMVGGAPRTNKYPGMCLDRQWSF